MMNEKLVQGEGHVLLQVIGQDGKERNREVEADGVGHFRIRRQRASRLDGIRGRGDLSRGRDGHFFLR